MLKIDHIAFLSPTGHYQVDGGPQTVGASRAAHAIERGCYVLPATHAVAVACAKLAKGHPLAQLLADVYGFEAPLDEEVAAADVEPEPIAPEDESARVHELLAAAGDSLPELKTLASQFGVEVSPRWNSKRIAGAITKSVSERLARDGK